MELGELPANSHRPVRPARCGQVVQEPLDPVGRLEDDHGPIGLSGDGSQALGPARPVRGKKPSKHQRSVDSPETTRAVNAADGPGTASTGIPAATAARTRRPPGSLTNGVPASVTRAMVAPPSRRSMAMAVLAASLKRWWETRRGPL